jgi:hypothetical protein
MHNATCAVGRQYLANTATPSAADITFAAFVAPILCPQPYAYHYMRVSDAPSDLPPALYATSQRLRSTPAGQVS